MLKVIGGAKEGKFKATASGTLPNGKPVVVNSDGTVSVVSSTGENVTQAVGSASIFESASTKAGAGVFDSANNKVVISYRDEGNNNYGTAVVGTIDDTTITFGSPVVFATEDTAGNFPIAGTFDSSNNKVVFAYQAGSSAGKAVVGTVSGTSISFGSPVTFHSSRSFDVCATFDTTNNKVVIGFRSNSQSEYGRAIVGTVSGTSISFGTSVVFNSAYSGNISCCFSPDAGKVVFAYRDEGASNYGKAIVGTVSGTSISYGSEATFLSFSCEGTNSVYDTTSNKVVVGYKKRNNSTNKVFGAIVGTISGTSISFGTRSDSTTQMFAERLGICYDSVADKTVFVVYQNSSPYPVLAFLGTVSGTSITLSSSISINASGDSSGSIPSAVFDSNKIRNVISFADSANSSYGTSKVLRNAYIGPNLTAENYIGISSGGAVADTQNATVDIIGTVNSDQTGLTTGEEYYVQSDGTLSTTADDPSVLAGTAISATKLVVKT